MLVDLLHKVAANPRVYDWIQQAVGCERVFSRVQRHFELSPGRSVLEVGAGTGLLRSYLPVQSKYIWLDSDPQKLQGFRQKYGSAAAILGDATQIGLGSGVVDDVLCASVTHHIPDETVASLFAEAARVARERLIFLDPVLSPSCRSRLLWSLDRGSFPRRPERLRELIAVDFVIEAEEEFEVMHRYLLCVAKPRRRAPARTSP